MNLEEKLDRICTEIREETVDSVLVEEAGARVWERLQHAPLRKCEDFQALLPAYRTGGLSEARALLLKDHLHECLACRKVATPPTGRPMVPAVRSMPVWKWAMAAGLAGLAVLSAWMLLNPATTSPVVAQSVDGVLYRGPAIDGGEIRTGKKTAVFLKLADGSIVEMSERTGLTLSQTRRNLTVHLKRGSIIVQAAKRSSGHLYVATPDCTVAVTGTVFSVNSGVKGSRVTVIEGAVQVAQNREEKVLRPGDQYASSSTMEPVAVTDEIAWSRNHEAHIALLRSLNAVDKRLQELHFPETRYSSRLLPLLPPETVIFASISNPGRPLAEAEQSFRQRVQENPQLMSWWREARPDEVIEKIRQASDYVGNEIVMAATTDNAGNPNDPVFLAELKHSGIVEFVKKTGWQQLQVIESGGVAAISKDGSALGRIKAALDNRTPAKFNATPFGSRIAETYRGGTGFLFAADLERITGGRGPVAMKYLVVEQDQTAGGTETRAALTLSGPRTGIASWLARPAPMGALDFVSPDASVVSAFVVKDPAAMLDDLMAVHPQIRQEMAKAESKLGVSIRSDLAATLGGEFVVAMDGAILPTPAWKVAVEVYDPARLQWAIEKLIAAVNRDNVIQMTSNAVGGRTYHSLKLSKATPVGEIHYVLVNGYLVAAPSRALLDRAIQQRSAGQSISRSAQFLSMLPRDHYPHFSALVYQNAGSSLVPAELQSLSRELKPLLVAAYGEEDRITLASTGSLLGLGVNTLSIGEFFRMGIGTNGGRSAYPK